MRDCLARKKLPVLKKIALAVAASFLVLIAVIATRPGTYTVERSIAVNAPVDVAYALVSDFHHFHRFSPWSALDPEMEKTFGGPESGVGATYAWKGNDKVGSGQMRVTAATANERVDMLLEFKEPFEATATTTFVLAPEGAGTKVTWSMEGTNNFVAKAFSLVFDMKDAIGADYEKGLAQLAVIAEEEVKTRAEEEAKARAEEAAAAEANAEVVVDGDDAPL